MLVFNVIEESAQGIVMTKAGHSGRHGTADESFGDV